MLRLRLKSAGEIGNTSATYRWPLGLNRTECSEAPQIILMAGRSRSFEDFRKKSHEVVCNSRVGVPKRDLSSGPAKHYRSKSETENMAPNPLCKSVRSFFRRHKPSRRTSARSIRCEPLEPRLVLSTLFTSSDVVVATGDAAPHDDGSLQGMFSHITQQPPIINDAGQVLFHAGVEVAAGPSHEGLFTVSPQAINQIVRDNQTVPEFGGTLANVGDLNFSMLPLNDAGQTIFTVDRILGVDEDRNTGYFVGNGTLEGLTEVLRESDAAPDVTGTNGQYRQIQSADPALNDVGQIAFTQALLNTHNAAEDDVAVFRSEASGAQIQIAREGQSYPNSTETFSGFSDPAINDNGQVAFLGYGSQVDGIYRGDGSAPLTVIAQEGAVINSAGETFGTGNGSNALGSKSAFGVPLNNRGQVAFRGDIETAGANPVGIFVGDGSELIEIVRDGDSIDDDQIFRSGGKRRVALNENGTVAFVGESRRISDGFQSDTIFRGDGNTPLQIIAQVGQRVPADDAEFFGFHQFAFNDAGQIAFIADLEFDSGESRRYGLFFYDDTLGILEIAQEGQLFNGTEIASLQFAGNSSGAFDFLPSNRDGLNNAGQVTFGFTLDNTDATQGVAIVNTDGSKVTLDYGDAVDSYHSSLATGGARHVAIGPVLGSNRDSESDGQPSANADGDDIDQANDDDGILQTGSIIATRSQPTTASFAAVASADGFLDAWIDFNGDGLFDDANEKIYNSVRVTTGTNVLAFDVPSNAQSGSTYARFRISSSGGLAPTGRAADGEVEDYFIAIEDGTTGTANLTVQQPTPGAIDIRFDTVTEQIVVHGGDGLSQELSRADFTVFQAIELHGTGGDDLVQLGDLNAGWDGSISVSGGDGYDVLQLTEHSQSLDLTQNVLSEIEEVDITGSGDNTMTVTAEAVSKNAPGKPMLRVRHNEGDTVQYGGQWTAEPPEIVAGQFVHVLKSDESTIEVENTRAFHNPLLSTDINRDSTVSPIDALIIINYLNAHLSGVLQPPTPDSDFSRFAYIDTNADGAVAPLDALIVINRLNKLFSGGEGENEAPPIHQTTRTFQPLPPANEPLLSGHRESIDLELASENLTTGAVEQSPSIGFLIAASQDRTPREDNHVHNDRDREAVLRATDDFFAELEIEKTRLGLRM